MTENVPTGHCFRCKQKRTIIDAVLSKTKTGQPMIIGKCSSCGTRISRFVAKEK